LAGALDVAGSNRAGDEAVVADAVEAARQDVQEKAADELGAVERQHRGKAGIRWMLGGPCDIDMIVPIDLLPPILGDLLTYCGVNKLVRPWLGIYLVESGGEVVIAAMADHRPATAAGLRHGDILASVRGAEIADVGDFYGKVWRCGEAGVEVLIEIIRDGRARSEDQVADRAGFLKRSRLQ